MDINERLDILQNEIEEIKKEIQALLVDIRIWVLEAQSPIRVSGLSQTAFEDSEVAPDSKNREVS